MGALITDLLDLARARLGTSIPISPSPMNMRDVCEVVVDEFRAAHPEIVLGTEYSGDLYGRWDAARLGQVVSNLVSNAVEHGAKNKPISLRVDGESGEITLSVQNEGPPVSSNVLATIDAILSRQNIYPSPNTTRFKLGLFIAREILASHGGTLQALSSENQNQVTRFTARWPRHAAAAVRVPLKDS